MSTQRSSMDVVSQAVHRGHYGVFDAREGTYCDACEQDWPCETITALHHVETVFRANTTSGPSRAVPPTGPGRDSTSFPQPQT